MRIKLLGLLWLSTILAIAQTTEFDGSGNDSMTYSVESTLSNTIINGIRSSFQKITIESDNQELSDSKVISLEVFPNPVKSTLKFRSNVKIITLSLYNVLGQKLIVYAMNKSSGAINIRDLANGIYLIKFETIDGDISVTKRILKN
ncbi:T9SS type A sorting domain-containing protein [Winogradskyella sp.]|uniref:T9SS type A sorting domain-containing protein n=1 Tax=Winogradskyella sp. TaxID=1883156 RepID=UPI0025DFD451|nr:T9SS type A sorting domain-containing protein [Winogradskyella sp.]